MLTNEAFHTTLEEVFRFHAKKAPGLAIGISLVDQVRDRLGPVKERLNAIAETPGCLVDVIMVMTGCTIGNNYLRIIPGLGRFALTMFDRFDGRGVRGAVDLARIDPRRTPELAAFYHRTRSAEVQIGGPAREASRVKIMEEFDRIGRDIFRFENVWVIDHGKPPVASAGICASCGESFLIEESGVSRCAICQGRYAYYRKTPS
ncbi:MAG TPA: FmdE family protein [Candidatus Ozemobacteraceae bacterium]|nr:FmdE family protein [Candidatus Ozemobacteraceae bacterium]